MAANGRLKHEPSLSESHAAPQTLPARAALAEDLQAIGQVLDAGPIDLDLGATLHTVRWIPVSQPPFALQVTVHVGGNVFDVWLDDGALVPELAPDAMAALSSNARKACFALALEPVLLRLEQVLARPVRLVSAEYRRLVDLPERSIGFELVGAHDSVVRNGAVAAQERGAWQRLVSTLPESVRPPGSRAVCTLVIGHTQLTRSQWRRLAPGWLVLVVRREVEPRGFALYGRSGTRLAAFTVDPGQVESRRIDGKSAMNVEMLDSVPDSVPDPAAPGSLREPSLELSFQIGAAHIALDELDALRMGDVLRLDRPIESSAVTVLCGGVEVATGELIDLDGSLAVRMIRVGPHD